jgi:Icc-related predicted phosphoesterase
LELKVKLAEDYPRIFVIMGNDDPRSQEPSFEKADFKGIWKYINNKKVSINGWDIFGYSFVPPTPFLLKDWERYDVSRFVDPACIPPEYGRRTVPVPDNEIKYSTIKKDLDKLSADSDLGRAIFLFHSPPYQSKLDRANLDGRTIDHVPLDVHVGSVAIMRFIKKRQPLLTLHGHIHESARLTGSWRDKIGRTHMISAAHDGPELAIVKFDLENLDSAERVLI